MNPVSATRQLEFIAYIQRLLVEGDFSATYKFALLHGLADICIEQLGTKIKDDDPFIISIDTITEKFIELYWQHSLPFGSKEKEGLILQNGGKQAAIITQLGDCRQQGIHSLNKLKASKHWKPLFSKTKQTIKTGPLWRLQILGNQVEEFLYDHNEKENYIALSAGVAYCFRRFYDLVVSVSRQHWLQKIRSIPANQKIIGEYGNVNEFLFGSQRNTLIKAKPVLFAIQNGNCFYCQKSIPENKGEVDHFIPWARYPSDLGHNFVLSCSACNNNKRDHLAAKPHYRRWLNQNLTQHKTLISNELSSAFVCESNRSLAVASWAYELAIQTGAQGWVSKGCFEPLQNYGQNNSNEFRENPKNIELNENTNNVVSFPIMAKTEVPYFSDLRIACGHFRTSEHETDEVEKITLPEKYGKLDSSKHFIARAVGDSMDGGKYPIKDGDFLLMEHITSNNAGSISNQIVAIERQDTSGDDQYLLRLVNKVRQGKYELIAQNTNYAPMNISEDMRTFARFRSLVQSLDINFRE